LSRAIRSVGPWQVAGGGLRGHAARLRSYAGEAFAIGERTPLALIDAPAFEPDGGGRRLHEPRGARIESLDK